MEFILVKYLSKVVVKLLKSFVVYCVKQSVHVG